MAGEAGRPPNPTAFLPMRYNLFYLPRYQPRFGQGRAAPLAERLPTVPTTQQPNILLFPHPLVYPQLAALCQLLTGVRTGQIGTSKLGDLLFDYSFWLPHAPLTSQTAPVIQIPQATKEKWTIKPLIRTSEAGEQKKGDKRNSLPRL
jgi:hypothetical protein